MELSRTDIKMMIEECVNRILEVHGALDEKLEGLAEVIIGRVKSGEDKFTLSREEIEQYYPYKRIPRLYGLGLVVCFFV